MKFPLVTSRTRLSLIGVPLNSKPSILELADRLRRDEVDAIPDRYEATPAHGWADWMQGQVAKADFELMI
jgi:hypothetical protein